LSSARLEIVKLAILAFWLRWAMADDSRGEGGCPGTSCRLARLFSGGISGCLGILSITEFDCIEAERSR